MNEEEYDPYGLNDPGPPQPEVVFVKSSPWKKIVLISGGVIILILTLLFLLNYFNIMSFSLVFPQYFSWLPHHPLDQSFF